MDIGSTCIIANKVEVTRDIDGDLKIKVWQDRRGAYPSTMTFVKVGDERTELVVDIDTPHPRRRHDD